MKKNKTSVIRIVTKSISLVIGTGEGAFFLLESVVGAAHSATWAVNALIMQRFFDSIQFAIQGTSPVYMVYLMMAAVAGITLVQQLFNSMHNFMGNMMGEKYSGIMRHALHKKAIRVDPVAYENPETLTDIEKARDGGDKALNILGILKGTIFFYGVYFVIMGAYLYSLAPVLLLSIPIIFVPSILSVFMRIKVFTKLEDIAAPARRKMEANEKAIGDRVFFKETRTLGAFAYFKKQYMDTLALFNRENWRADRKTTLCQLVLQIATLAGYFSIIYLLFTLLLGGRISIGAFAAVLGSIQMLIGIMNEMVSRNFSQMAEAVGKAGNFVRFLDLPERTGKAVLSGPAEVELKDAAFRYPGANRDALCGVSLKINAGETLAIVGENGAGKSTLVRLITGLYLPTAGSVTLRGSETRDIAPEALYNGMSAVMQAYQRYKLTLKQNITAGDTSSTESIVLSAEKADIPLDAALFPDGEETVLSREFDGIDLSGGQWQRVALARGFYRTHDMIVLDEPTAAIDPLEETRLYHKFADLSRGKTAVIVTHRLGSARIADRIVVMDGGKIDSIGTHDELMRASGKYAEMFKAQAGWYAGSGAE